MPERRSKISCDRLNIGLQTINKSTGVPKISIDIEYINPFTGAGGKNKE